MRKSENDVIALDDKLGSHEREPETSKVATLEVRTCLGSQRTNRKR